MTDERPNVVLIHCHDLGQHLGCYGRGVQTPNVDRLAIEGVRFENHFATAPQCSPSRGSIMTGKYPHRNGVMGLTHRGWKLNEGERLLPSYLSEAGYETRLFGFQQVAEDASGLGYDETWTVSSGAFDVVEQFESRIDGIADDAPFLASLGFHEPHRPFQREHVPDEAYDYYHPENVDPLPYLPDERGIREEIAEFDALVTHVNEAVGRLYDALDDSGLLSETVVLFTTDHGIAFPRAKATVYDPGVETALIARYPERFGEGVVRDELLSNVDLLPTLVDLAGGEMTDDVDGRSFLPLLDGDDYDSRDQVFLEMTWHSLYNPIRAVRTERYKYVHNLWQLPLANLPGPMFGSKSGRVVREAYYTQDRPEEELYDLQEDPHERHNLAPNDGISRQGHDADGDSTPTPAGSDDTKHADLLTAFRRQVDDWMARTHDPLCDGPVPVPTTR